MLIFRCDVIDYVFRNEINFLTYDDYYILPESLIPSFEKFLLGARSLFYEKLQKYFDLFFESGIRQQIKNLLELKKDNVARSKAAFISNNKFLLNLGDLFGVFIILAFGFLVGFISFLVELSPNVFKKLRKWIYVLYLHRIWDLN